MMKSYKKARKQQAASAARRSCSALPVALLCTQRSAVSQSVSRVTGQGRDSYGCPMKKKNYRLLSLLDKREEKQR